MKSLCLLPLVLLLAGSSPAIAQDVRYNFDKQADFAGFKTYKWVALKDAAKLNDLVDKQIRDAIDAELAKKGLTKSDADTADLYIGYQAGVGTEKQYTSFDSGWGYGPGWGHGWYGAGGGGMTTGTTSTIYVGQLALDMYQASAKDLGVARHGHQDARHGRQARKAAEEPRQGCGEDVEELSAEEGIVRSKRDPFELVRTIGLTLPDVEAATKYRRLAGAESGRLFHGGPGRPCVGRARLARGEEPRRGS